MGIYADFILIVAGQVLLRETRIGPYAKIRTTPQAHYKVQYLARFGIIRTLIVTVQVLKQANR